MKIVKSGSRPLDDVEEFLKPKCSLDRRLGYKLQLLSRNGILRLMRVGADMGVAFDDGVSFIVLSSNDALNQKTQINAEEVMRRGAQLIEVGYGKAASGQLALPGALDAVVPFLQARAVQMISYFAALGKGKNEDQPKNFAKSVTVE